MRTIYFTFMLFVIGGSIVVGSPGDTTSPLKPILTNTRQIEKGDKALVHKNGRLYYSGLPFDGTVLAYFEEGQIKSVSRWKNGWQEGLSSGWYPDGRIFYERFYTHGKKSGDHRAWWPDGSRRFVYHFEEGLHEGRAQEWYPNGHKYRDFHYVKGKESGSQLMWYDDGRPRANYVVKNGRRYGLIGSKPCANPASL